MELFKEIKREIQFNEKHQSIVNALSVKTDVSNKNKVCSLLTAFLNKKITSDNKAYLQDKDLLDTLSSMLYFCLFVDNELAELVDGYLRSERLDTDSQLLGYISNLVSSLSEATDIQQAIVDSLFNQFLKRVQREIVHIHSLNRIVQSGEEFSAPKQRIDVVDNSYELKVEFKKAERVLKRLNDDDEKVKVKQYLTYRIQHLIKGVV